MIVNHEKKWAYIGPPKTSSTTLAYLLTDGVYQDNKWGKKLPDNFYGTSEGGQHTPSPPDKFPYDGYFIFITTRNPFERIVSLWGHWKFGRNAEESKIDKTNVDLKEFLKLILSGNTLEDIGGKGFFHFTLNQWVETYHDYIKIENLYEDILKLNLHTVDFKVPHCNKNLIMRTKIDKTWQELHTPKTIELTKIWAKEDFEKFEYSNKL